MGGEEDSIQPHILFHTVFQLRRIKPHACQKSGTCHDRSRQGPCCQDGQIKAAPPRNCTQARDHQVFRCSWRGLSTGCSDTLAFKLVLAVQTSCLAVCRRFSFCTRVVVSPRKASLRMPCLTSEQERTG